MTSQFNPPQLTVDRLFPTLHSIRSFGFQTAEILEISAVLLLVSRPSAYDIIWPRAVDAAGVALPLEKYVIGEVMRSRQSNTETPAGPSE
jgi:hypothetical protein